LSSASVENVTRSKEFGEGNNKGLKKRKQWSVENPTALTLCYDVGLLGLN